MRMVKQQNLNDCHLAAVAMIAGKTYAELWSPEFVAKVVAASGCNPELAAEVLLIAGYQERVDYWRVYTWDITQDTRRLLMGRKAILSVPSLNYEHGSHAVAWDGHKVLDPSNMQVYQWLDQLQITSAIIFNETGVKP